ncbi:hypothetical protein [Hyphomicrobium sp. 99]|uniref:hypothetical protein n=1 Tax=Hyphomicrobium sp. 99 TaxID=1163419 RepID=UPI0005F7FCB4|nr:hypothetical protein [Hyphomicrobium sp. 99]
MSTIVERPPLNPYLVLAIAVVFPGGGHIAAGFLERGLRFAFFTLLMALFTWHFSTPEQSLVGRTAGGLFVWALSIPDAYKLARIRYEVWKSKRFRG